MIKRASQNKKRPNIVEPEARNFSVPISAAATSMTVAVCIDPIKQARGYLSIYLAFYGRFLWLLQSMLGVRYMFRPIYRYLLE